MSRATTQTFSLIAPQRTGASLQTQQAHSKQPSKSRRRGKPNGHKYCHVQQCHRSPIRQVDRPDLPNGIDGSPPSTSHPDFPVGCHPRTYRGVVPWCLEARRAAPRDVESPRSATPHSTKSVSSADQAGSRLDTHEWVCQAEPSILPRRLWFEHRGYTQLRSPERQT